MFDTDKKLYEVFCDFDTNSTMAWTLIQSYQYKNNHQFKNNPLTKDRPVNEDTPVWHSYRLSKSRMKSIQEDSSKWRMTCRYDTDGLNYTDYVRGSNKELDILTYARGASCKEVEFINIRGHECTGCKADVFQGDTLTLHIYPSNKKCSFQVINFPDCEENFGYYNCINEKHRCTSSQKSTSQTWFGRSVLN